MSEFQALERLITQRFDGMDARVDRLTIQVTETNGRLRGAERDIANIQPRLGTVEREMGEVRERVDDIRDAVREDPHRSSASQDAGDNRIVRWYHAAIFTAGFGLALAVLKLIGKL